MSDTVKVALRIRPVRGNASPKSCLAVYPKERQVVISKQTTAFSPPTATTPGKPNFAATSTADPKPFTFDHVYGPNAGQEAVYVSAGKGLVDEFLEGKNVTVFAYGQTGSGKTHTMIGSESEETPESERVGLIPRIVQEIFSKLKVKQQLSESTQTKIMVSFSEIYQEQVRDLLSLDSRDKEIIIRETSDREIILSGITEFIVDNADDLLRIVSEGAKTRTTADTLIHDRSSRSHAILTITLQQMLNDQSCVVSDLVSDGSEGTTTMGNIVKRSKFHLVDLAGAERMKKSGTEGIRMREGVKINTGLLALGHVISTLSDYSENSASSGKAPHVPYRNSKLTRILQDSLGGNAKTLMIACVSPSTDDYEETLNTLNYASRARFIQNQPIVNVVDLNAVKIQSMQVKISELEEKLKLSEEEKQAQLKKETDTKAIIENLKGLKLDTNQLNILASGLGDEVMMQYFVEELKARTIRSTNAIHSLQKANEKNAELTEKASELTEKNAELNDRNTQLLNENSELQAKIRDMELNLNSLHKKILDLENVAMDGQLDMRELFEIILCFVTGGSLEQGQELFLRKCVAKWGTGVQNEAFDNLANFHSTVTTPRLVPSESADSLASTNTNSSMDPRALRREKRRASSMMNLAKLSDSVQVHMTTVSPNDSPLMKVTNIRQDSGVKVDTEEDSVQHQFPVSDKAEQSGNDPLVPSDQTSAFNSHILSRSGNTESTPQSPPANYLTLTVDEVKSLQKDLSTALKHKVELMRDLTRANKEFERVRGELNDRIMRQERELENCNREINNLHKELNDKDTTNQKAREQMEKKIKELENTIAKLKSTQRDSEKIIKEREFTERKLTELQNESEKQGSTIVELKKKVKESQEKLSEVETRRMKEISLLKRQSEDLEKKIRQLEGTHEKLRMKYDRKVDEVAVLSKKLKDFSTINSVSRNIKAGTVGKKDELLQKKDSAATLVSTPNSGGALQDLPDTKENVLVFENSKSEQKLSVLATASQDMDGTENQVAVTRLRQEIKHKAEQIEHLKTQVLILEKKYEKKVERIISKYEAQVHQLNNMVVVRETHAASTQTTVIEPTEPHKASTVQSHSKDADYYRRTNRELKSKLREFMAANEQLVQVINDLKTGKGASASSKANDIVQSVELMS